MSSERAKLVVCLASNAATAALVFWFVRAHFERDVPSVELAFAAHAPTSDAQSTAHPQSEGLAPLDVASPRFPASTFRRGPLSPELDGARFDLPSSSMRFDPHCLFAFQPNLARERPQPDHASGRWTLRTNSLGLRNDAEVALGPVDARVLVGGDSQTSGFCDNADTFASRIEAWLRSRHAGRSIEVLNAAVPGYGFFQHLGVLERFLPLEPDVYVAVVFGGNDFVEALGFQHRFHGTQAADPGELAGAQDALDEIRQGAFGHVFLALAQFRRDPAQIEVALQAARDYTTEILVTCARHGVQPVFAYVPPITDLPGALPDEQLERLCGELGLSTADLRAVDRMAESWIQFVRWQRAPLVDLRPAFRAAHEKLFWDFDLHLSLAGHALVARELGPAIEAAANTAGRDVRRGSPALARGSAEERALRSPGAAEIGER
jgi:hypothetical protein